MKTRLIRPLFISALCAAALANAQPRPQPQGQLDASETLFTVLAALDVAGEQAAPDASAVNAGIRTQVRDAIAAKRLESADLLKRFFEDHRLKDRGANLSQYISFALTLEGPPDFRYRLKPEEIPPDVKKLEGLDALIARFYRDAGIGDLWKRARAAHDQLIANYHSGLTQALLESNAYLRNPTSGFRGRRFQVFVDLLGPPNQIQTRSYKDDYFVVVTASAEPQIQEVRHAYLHYLLDPLALRFNEQLNHLRALADFAEPAPALDNAYKDDFVLLATECLIKAVESRLAHGAEEKQALVDQALREGFVLTPGLADALAVYEKQEQAMLLYYPDLVGKIDLEHEDQRLAKVQFASAPAGRKVEHAAEPAEPVLTGAEKALADAEESYTRRDLDRARQGYLKVLEATGNPEVHAKAYYGLARIATLRSDPELAEKMFQKTLEMSPDSVTKSWAFLYLGRLADAAGEREEAQKNYRAVLAIEQAPAAARSAAEKGLAQPFGRDK